MEGRVGAVKPGAGAAAGAPRGPSTGLPRRACGGYLLPMMSRASRACPDCGAPNPLEADACVECNHLLSPIATVGLPRGEASGPAAGDDPGGAGLPAGAAPAGPRRPRPRPAPGGGLLGSRAVTEEPGKVIPRRRHARATFFGIGGAGEEQPGGAPSWIWFAVAGGALVIAVIAAIGITSQRPPFALPNGSRAQAAAADSLAKLLDRDSLDVAANVALGNLLYDTGNFGAAVRYYRRGLAARPDQPDVRVDLATSLHQSGHSPEAVAELQEVIAAHPGHALARFNLAIIYESLGRLEDAAAAFRSLDELPLSAELRAEVAKHLQRVVEKQGAAAAPAGRAPARPPAGR